MSAHQNCTEIFGYKETEYIYVIEKEDGKKENVSCCQGNVFRSMIIESKRDTTHIETIDAKNNNNATSRFLLQRNKQKNEIHV